MTELVPGPLQLRLQAFNANHRLQQVLVKICIFLLQRPEHRRIMGEGVTTYSASLLAQRYLLSCSFS